MKLAIISGSEGGIGHALYFELAQRGYQVCGLDVVKDPKLDITASLQDTFKSFTRGGKEIAIVINCAGITRENSIKQRRKPMMAKLREQMEVNFFGAMNVCKESLKYMRNGSIVNIASKSAFHALPNRLGYCASKGAMVSASKQMALDLAPHIRVNSVSPGQIDTDMPNSIVKETKVVNNLLKRKGTPEEVANFIINIAENKYVTGQDFIIDGGYCAV